ncbi:MAG: SUMF1/EgtB/PvdO family nonheme iron enzyme, partial [Planctomycetales bacterium]|nr:SUMF1/EgtB/PvdO family nonheme iron enzyme [Planctomycetales bacterium]
ISKAVADALVNQPAIDADYFARVLSPSFKWLVPHLVTLVHSEETLESVRSTSIALLARYGQNHPDELAQLIPAAEPNDFRVLLDALKENVDQATPILKSALDKDWSLNQISKESPGLQSREWERKLDREHRRQATVAATLWHIGHRQDVLQKLRRNQNSGLRAWIIERLGLFEIPMEHLVEAARVESDAGVRQALLLAASQSSIPDSPAVRTTLLKRMSYFTSDEDPGVSSAGRWLISQTLNSPDSANETIEGNGNFRKFAGNEHVFVKVSRPGSFLLGSPEDELLREEDEAQIEVVIDYDFSIATTEVTVAQFRMFREKEYNSQYSPDAHCPMNNVTFFDAAAYCRWLSEQAGIPEDEMCYPPIEQIGPGMRLPENWLERSGYRLPTEAEWEYACRGGTDGPRYFGEGRELALRYLWCLHNGEDRTHPVAQLKPNNFGLFDMLGNINEMCHSSRLPGRFVFSAEDFLPRRGGDFTDVVQNVRVARYSTVECSAEWANLGFRIARRTPISK